METAMPAASITLPRSDIPPIVTDRQSVPRKKLKKGNGKINFDTCDFFAGIF
jgi:hypothetical protein